MATVTAEIGLDAKGLADANPYTDPLITEVGGGVQVLDGAFKSPGSTAGGFITNDAPVIDMIESFVELVDISSGDPCGPLLLNDLGNGYWLYCNFSEVRPYKITNYAVASSRMGAATNATVAAFDQVSIKIDESTGTITTYHNGLLLETLTDTEYTGLKAGLYSIKSNSNLGGAASWGADGYAIAAADYTQRKGSTFDISHGLTTITTATLGGVAITINSTGTGTVNLTDTSGLTTSGVYDLVLGDGSGTETYTIQLNVYGIAPSNNPVQKDGAPLTGLTNVELRISSGTTIAGSELFYTSTATTDGSGNLSVIDLSDTAVIDGDPVLFSIRTSTGYSIIAAESVELI